MARSLGGTLALLASLPFAFPPALSGQLPAILEVQVTASSPGQVAAGPVAGVRVEVPGTSVAGTTDRDGRVRLRGLSPGAHRVVASHLGYAEAGREVEVANGRTTRIELELVPRPLLLEGLQVEGERGPGPAGSVLLRPEAGRPGLRSVADLVESVPGLSVVRQGGPGAPAVASIRGSSGDQVLVLLDGVPLNAPLTGEADLSSVDLSDVAHVVVVIGAASSRYGAGALAGAILIETGRRRDASLTAGLTVGSHGELGAMAAAGTPLDSGERWALDTRVQAERSRGDFRYRVPGFRGGGEARRLNAGHDAVRGHLSLSHAGERRGRIRLHGEQSGRGAPGTVVQPSLTGDRTETRGGMSASLESGHPREGWRVLANTAFHRAEHQDPSPPFGPAYRSSTRVADLGLRLEGWRDRGPLSLQGGAAGQARRLRASALESEGPSQVREVGAWLASTLAGGDASGRSGSLPGFVRATGAVRLDRHDLHPHLVVSPALGAEFIRGEIRTGIRWARAFSPPSLADLFFQEGVLVQANPELGPERVTGEWTGELAWGRSFRAFRTELQLSLFQGDVDGMILWFPDHRFVWSPHNYDVRRRGGSLGGEIRWPARGASLRGSLDRTRVTYTGPVLSGQVVHRPEWEGSLSARWEGERLDAHTTFRSHGPRRTAPGSALNRLAGFHTVDAGLALPFQLGSRLGGRAELVVRNALDVHASFLADYPLPGRWWTLSVRLDRGS